MTKFEKEVRFNWGFWDAINDRIKGRPERIVGAVHAGAFPLNPKEKEYARAYRAVWAEIETVEECATIHASGERTIAYRAA